MKYIFKQIDDISGANAVSTIEFDADTMSTILEHFEMFIRGSGFHPSGILDFVEDDGVGYTTPKFECAEEDYDDEEETHEWTQTIRDDSEWPFPKDRPVEGSKTEPWPGVAPSVSSQFLVEKSKDTNAN